MLYRGWRPYGPRGGCCAISLLLLPLMLLAGLFRRQDERQA
jgi:hypothetical protein